MDEIDVQQTADQSDPLSSDICDTDETTSESGDDTSHNVLNYSVLFKGTVTTRSGRTASRFLWSKQLKCHPTASTGFIDRSGRTFTSKPKHPQACVRVRACWCMFEP